MSHRIQLLLAILIASVETYDITSCIPDTPCRCYLTQYSLTLSNCSQNLADLPIFDSQNVNDITRIIARNALTQWPNRLCQYSSIQILDLSGSYLDSQSTDFSCLTHLVHVNLSNTQLTKIPIFQNNYLQILDLSNNNIKHIDGNDFQPMNNLLSLFLQNNPIQSIDHLGSIFQLANIQLVNLVSSYPDVTLQQSVTIPQWIQLANQWENSTKSFLVRMNNIPFQSIIPNPEQFQMIPSESMTTILEMFINSTFVTLFNTPKCNCFHLREYQRSFTYVGYSKKYTSSLFQFTKCLMPDGITYARLFDRFTYVDLRCPLLGKISFYPLLSRSSSIVLARSFILFILLSSFVLY
ncbi:unnamed protein product [Adineta ricciae]|uniref:Uncharacterized protein n=1 Tax=Adineta ricciae TaxID=249248 RepID=A0A814B1P8_ADIRI|nr:unnamed protein product [Adineta ricciae]